MRKPTIERDILRAARAYGHLGGSNDEGTKWLTGLHSETRENQRLTVTLIALVESGHLLATRDPEGNVLQPYARGITPKGEERLYELEHPVRAWLQRNWFPFVVACVTTVVGVAGVVVPLVN